MMAVLQKRYVHFVQEIIPNPNSKRAFSCFDVLFYFPSWKNTSRKIGIVYCSHNLWTFAFLYPFKKNRVIGIIFYFCIQFLGHEKFERNFSLMNVYFFFWYPCVFVLVHTAICNGKRDMLRRSSSFVSFRESRKRKKEKKAKVGNYRKTHPRCALTPTTLVYSDSVENRILFSELWCLFPTKWIKVLSS